MNEYEAKQEARRERLLAAAERMQAASDSAYRRARDMASVIPLGQPILVGHHSEKRDRSYRARIWRTQDRCLELQKKAEYLRGLAAGVGQAGISSDDPGAVGKLRERLAKLEEDQRKMRAINAAVRREKKNGEAAQVAAVMKVGNYSEGAALKLLSPDFCGRIGVPDYMLANNNANIRRIRERVQALEKRPTEDLERELPAGVTYREDSTENRVMLLFPGKPSAEVRGVLKSVGFKWSPTRGAWVRMLNNAGRAAAQYAIQRITERSEVKVA